MTLGDQSWGVLFSQWDGNIYRIASNQIGGSLIGGTWVCLSLNTGIRLKGYPPVSSMENPHNFYRWFSQLDISISRESSIIWMIFNCHPWLPEGYFHRAVKFDTTRSSGNWQPWRFQGQFWLHLCPQVNDSNFQRFLLVEPRLQFRSITERPEIQLSAQPEA